MSRFNENVCKHLCCKLLTQFIIWVCLTFSEILIYRKRMLGKTMWSIPLENVHKSRNNYIAWYYYIRTRGESKIRKRKSRVTYQLLEQYAECREKQEQRETAERPERVDRLLLSIGWNRLFPYSKAGLVLKKTVFLRHWFNSFNIKRKEAYSFSSFSMP